MVALLFVLLPGLSLCLPTGREKEDVLDLTVIHINDFHAHFQQTSVHTSRCREQDSECYGGVPRVYEKAMEIRQEDPEALFLNAGDFFQGTAWYTKLKYGPMVEFGNMLNYTAMGVGNHDFDDSVQGFVPFAEQAKYQLLGANIESHEGSFHEGTHFNKSMVTLVKGRQVGIIGYVTRSTAYNFPDHEVVFNDEIEAVKEEAKALKEAGVEIIIALGHSGYDIDQELAREVPELDLVVGGHSHTFLFTPSPSNPKPPSTEYPRGEYPTYVTQSGGKVVPVVQAYCYTKYLGHLKLKFDSFGELLTPVQTQGVTYAQPELLSGKLVGQSSLVLDAMEKWMANLTEFQETIGYNEVLLKEEGPSKESNLGDFLCDAFAGAYENTRIAFSNNGGIRSSLEMGDVLYDDILYILPFDNTLDLVTMRGEGIKNVLEKMCERLNPDDIYEYPGFGYQLAGLNFEVLVTNDNVGSRVNNLRVKGEDGSYSDIEDDAIYNVALPSFLAGGFHKSQKAKSRQVRSKGVFDDDILSHVPGTILSYEAMKEWVIQNSPINQEIEGRWYIATV